MAPGTGARRHSAGVLLFSRRPTRVLLVHPGGPFWRGRDDGAWSIPKGEVDPDEDAAVAARREFSEELGPCPQGPFQGLGDVVRPGGKRVTAFALEGAFDPASLISNRFTLEWPPRSGRMQSFPEVDRAAWYDLAEAQRKILAGQRPFLDRLQAWLEDGNNPSASD